VPTELLKEASDQSGKLSE